MLTVRFHSCSQIGRSLVLALAVAVALGSAPPPSRAESPPALSPTRPLPPASEVLDRFAKNSDRDRDNDLQFRRLYQYDKTTVSEEKDASGKILKSESRSIHHDPEKFARNQGDVPEGAQTATPSSNRRSGRGSRQMEITQDLLSRFTFDVEAREQIHGRPTLRLKFSPAPKSQKSQENGVQDRILRQLRGHLWIDEDDGLMQKAKFELSAPIEFFAGIAGAIQSLSVEMTRRRTDDGLWFTERMDWSFAGRQLLSRRSASGYEIRTNWSKVAPTPFTLPTTLSP